MADEKKIGVPKCVLHFQVIILICYKFPGKREEKERMTRFYGLFHSGNKERDIRIRARTISTSGRRNVVHFRTLSVICKQQIILLSL